ncbi:MAG TPA: nucleotide exchange factor GrpE [Jatrophihabitans sp.]
MSGTPPEEPVVVTDKRKVKLDPDSGEASVEEVAGSIPATSEPAATPDGAPGEEAALLEERTADLQRLQAEYANYRKRAERDRLAAGDIAIGRVLANFLPVLDNLDRARSHGDLNAGLKAVADQLDDIFGKLGLVAFGEVGDPFDPELHEAVMHDVSDEVTETICTTIMRPGYRHGERLLRPAMVAVTEPASPPSSPEADPAP